MKPNFVTTRKNGKSNQQVIIDLVSGAEPGTQFTFAQLAAALGEGTDREYERKEVQGVVRNANHRLLREYKRCLRSVRGVGYVMAHARDHMELAEGRGTKARRQIKWAVETLQNVKHDELTDHERATNMVLMQVYRNQELTFKRLSRTESLIAGLTHKVDQLEGKHQDKGK